MIRLIGLPLPVSKNTLHVPVRCGKWTKLVRSKKARLREQEIVACIWRQIGRPAKPCFTRPVSITWTITFPDRRPRDGQNYFEQLADCLQAAGVVEDDSLLVHEVRETMPHFRKPGSVDLEIRELP